MKPLKLPHYRLSHTALDSEIRRKITQEWEAEHKQATGSSPLLGSLGVFGFFLLLGAGLGALSLLDGPYNIWLALFLALAGAVLGGWIYLNLRARGRNIEAAVAELHSQAEGWRFELDLTEHHAFVWHEHGLFLMADVGEGMSFVEDFSSINDDGRYDRMEGFLRSRQIPSHWSWWQVDGRLLPVAFTMEGAMIPLQQWEEQETTVETLWKLIETAPEWEETRLLALDWDSLRQRVREG